MMKKLLGISLVALSLTALAAEDIWTVSSATAEYSYTVLPTTAKAEQFSDTIQWSAVVESKNLKTEAISRIRVLVTGCEKLSGKTAFADMDSKLPPDSKILDWDADGPRVYDGLALKICYAYVLKQNANSADKKPVKKVSPKYDGKMV